MADTIKFSAFTTKAKSSAFDPSYINYHFLSGVDTFLDENFKFNLADLLPSATSVGGGTSLFKEMTDYTVVNLKSLVAGSSALTITSATDTVTLDVDPSALTLSDLSGVTPISKGGTGSSLSDPGADRILFWDDSAGVMTFLEAGSNLTISGTTISASFASPLSVKGDLYTHNGTGDVRLPIGSDGYVLSADSTEASGLRWVVMPTAADYAKVAVDSAATPDYIGISSSTGVLRTTSKISKADGGNYITLDVYEPVLDLNLMDNTNARMIKQYTMTENLTTSAFYLSYTGEDEGLVFETDNRMSYYNLLEDTYNELGDLNIYRNISGGNRGLGGASIKLVKNSSFVDTNDVLARIVMTSADQNPGSEAEDTVDGSVVLETLASEQHSTSARGGIFKIKIKSTSEGPNSSASTSLTMTSELATFNTPIATDAGTLGSTGDWRLGTYTASAPTANGYVEVEIDGVLYQLLAYTT
jgi:hypothetical protein